MIEKQKLRELKLWYEDPVPVKGGRGDITLAYMSSGGLKGDFQVDILRENATRVLGENIDLTANKRIGVNVLPEDIQKDLIHIFNKIEKLLG
jgi:hypothetical protein